MARWADRVCVGTRLPRALATLYYLGPQRACPAGEQGWMAKTDKCENKRPPRACHVGEEDWRSCASWGTSFTGRASRTGSGCELRFGGSLPASFTVRTSRTGSDATVSYNEGDALMGWENHGPSAQERAAFQRTKLAYFRPTAIDDSGSILRRPSVFPCDATCPPATQRGTTLRIVDRDAERRTPIVAA